MRRKGVRLSNFLIACVKKVDNGLIFVGVYYCILNNCDFGTIVVQ